MQPGSLRKAPKARQAEQTANFAVDRDIVRRRGRARPLPRAESSIQQLLGQVLETTPALVVLIDSVGRVLYLNRACKSAIGIARGEALGKSIGTLLKSGRSRWRQALHPRSHSRRSSSTIYEERWRGAKEDERVIEWRYERIHAPGAKKPWVLGTGIDVTEKRRAEDDRRRLSARLLGAQDAERRRLARELHDSTVQKLAAISMNLTAGTTTPDLPHQNLLQILADTMDLVDDCAREVRTVSYLLHPPLLDELGLVLALKSYVRGFSQRSHIKVTLQTPSKWRRCAQDLELAIFRVVQESLTNVHRHSGNRWAAIRLNRSRNRIILEIEDIAERPAGKRSKEGSVAHKAEGVGIAGMTERLRHLGGDLQIQRRRTGTIVRAIIKHFADGESLL